MNFTTEELMVLKIYGETTERESHELNDIMDADISLKNEYKYLAETHFSIPRSSLLPDEKILKNILAYSLQFRQN